MFGLSRSSNLSKLKDNNSTYYLFYEGDKSLYLQEDTSGGCVHHHCIEWFISPCTEGIIFKDVSHSCNQDLIRGPLLICEALLVLCGVLIITLVMSTGMTFGLRIGTSLATKLGRVARLAV